MYLRLFTFVVSVSAVLSLRGFTQKSADAELEILENNELGEKLVNHFLETARAQQKAQVEADKAFRVQKNQERAASGAHLSSANTLPSNVITQGYLVNRTRSNADCSGVVSTLYGQRLWCQSYGTTSFGKACANVPEKGNVMEAHFEYNNGDCTGEPAFMFGETKYKSCAFDFESYGYNKVFEMNSVQCSRETSYAALREPGIVISSHADDQCQSEPSFFMNMRFGACTLMSFGDQYQYMKFTRCKSGNKVEAIFFSDSSCLRPLFRATTTFQGPTPRGVCAYQGYEYMTTQCID